MTDDRYEIRGKIGQGGVGAVYRAYDTQLRREVAIKRVLTEGGYESAETATTNLLKEATALSSVQHPHICTVYDAGMDAEGPYVVMEMINGKTLDEMVEIGTLTYDDFREVAIQSQEAMIAAQDLDLVHRDLKPSNVMVCWLPSGRFQVKLVDFGLAKFSATPSLQTIDHGDAVFGSIFFMAPEQFERTPLDRRTDMYSLGALYYYALTGNYPFNGETAPQVMASHLQGTVQPLNEVRPDLPMWLCNWVMWHIKRNMDERPDSARVALEKFIADEAAAAQGMAGGAPLGGLTSPQLAAPATGAQPVHPAGALTSPNAVRPTTSSVGVVPATSPQPVRPATASQGVTPVQAHTGQVSATGVGSAAESGIADSTQLPVDLKANNTKKIVIAAVIGVAIIIASIVIVNMVAGDKETDIINNLSAKVQDDDIPMSEKEFDIFLKHAVMPVLEDGVQRETLLKCLQKSSPSDSYSPDKKIMQAISEGEMRDETRGQLFLLLAYRKNTEVLDDLFDYIINFEGDNLSPFAIQACSAMASEEHIGKFNEIIKNTKSSSTLRESQKALHKLIAAADKKSAIATLLIKEYNTAMDEKTKHTYIRLLGSTGTNEALELLKSVLTSNKSGLRRASSKALSLWPSDEPFEAMLQALDEEEDTAARKAMFSDTLQLLIAKRDHDGDYEERWRNISESADSDREIMEFINSIGKLREPWVGDIVRPFAAAPYSNDVQDRAERVLDR